MLLCFCVVGCTTSLSITVAMASFSISDRLVRWDVGPMDEVRQNLQRFEKQQEDSLQPNAGGGGLSMDKIADQVSHLVATTNNMHEHTFLYTVRPYAVTYAGSLTIIDSVL